MSELQDLMHQLVTGGFETTTSAIATGMWLLVRHPDQLATLRADPSLLDNFIDESLRFDSPVAGPLAAGDVPGRRRRGATSRRAPT